MNMNEVDLDDYQSQYLHYILPKCKATGQVCTLRTLLILKMRLYKWFHRVLQENVISKPFHLVLAPPLSKRQTQTKVGLVT